MTEIQTVTVEHTFAPEIVEVHTGARGPQGPGWLTGSYPFEEAMGEPGTNYVVTQGNTNLGNIYQKGSGGTWTMVGNLRGPQGSVASVNGKSDVNIILSANDITTGVLPLSQLPTGTTAETVALGNHHHDSKYQMIIPTGTTSQYYRGDKTWAALDRAAVGLGNVDNTSDLEKPVSTATQEALDAKKDRYFSTTSVTVLHDVVVDSLGYETLRYVRINTNVPTTTPMWLTLYIKAYSPTNGVVDGVLSLRTSSGGISSARWVNAGDYYPTVSTHKDDNGKVVIVFDGNAWDLSRFYVSEANVSLTGDQRFYFSGWTVTNSETLAGLTHYPLASSIDLGNKEDALPTGGTTSHYLRGDKTWQTFDKAVVGLGNVDNTSDLAKPISTATQNALDTKAPLNSPTFTGTVSGVSKAMVGLGNVDNTADLAKPISTATQNALDLKAPKHNATFTGVLTADNFVGNGAGITGLSKTQVGLGNVNNTADIDKPISTAVQSALDALSTNQQGNPATKLGPIYAALARRNFYPARFAFLGSSTTFGLAASSDKFRFADVFIQTLQTTHPSPIPGYFPQVQTLSQGLSNNNLVPGVQGFNAGAGGNTSRNYCTSTHLYGFGILNPDCFIHMIGSNDSTDSPDYAVPPEEYKSNVLNAINSIDNLSSTGTPACHVLVHTYRREGVSLSHWAEYGKALREIADSKSNVVFINMQDVYEGAKMPGDDPYDLLSTDFVHQTDAGHAMMAELLIKGMGLDGVASSNNNDLVLYDTYTTSATALTGPEFPANRTYNALTGAWAIADGRMVCNTAGTLFIDSGVSDIDVSCLVNVGSGAALAGNIWRATNDANRWSTLINRGSQKLQIWRMLSGTNTMVAEASYTFTAGRDYFLRTIVKGDKAVGYVNGTPLVTYALPTDDPLKTAKGTGFRVSSVTAGLTFGGFAVRRS